MCYLENILVDFSDYLSTTRSTVIGLNKPTTPLISCQYNFKISLLYISIRVAQSIACLLNTSIKSVSIRTDWLIEGMLVAGQDIGMNNAIAKGMPDEETHKRKPS